MFVELIRGSPSAGANVEVDRGGLDAGQALRAAGPLSPLGRAAMTNAASADGAPLRPSSVCLLAVHPELRLDGEGRTRGKDGERRTACDLDLDSSYHSTLDPEDVHLDSLALGQRFVRTTVTPSGLRSLSLSAFDRSSRSPSGSASEHECGRRLPTRTVSDLRVRM
jgi:hypothetical protein